MKSSCNILGQNLKECLCIGHKKIAIYFAGYIIAYCFGIDKHLIQWYLKISKTTTRRILLQIDERPSEKSHLKQSSKI